MLLTIIDNPLEPSKQVTYEIDDLCASCKKFYPIWPAYARIYNETISISNDITPTSPIEVDELINYKGPFFIVNYPGEPLSTSFLVSILLFGVAAAASYLLRPSTAVAAAETISTRNTEAASPNNSLSARQNQARINSRIPDIFGTVRSIPDLIAAPYTVFADNQETEYSYMCVGRGSYEIDDICDDTTPIEEISGASVEVYGPYTSPNSGTPEIRIGSAINTHLYNMTKLTGVNGQVLTAPNAGKVVGAANIMFSYPNYVSINPIAEIYLSDYFVAGTIVVILNGTYSGFRNVGGVPIHKSIDVSGTYVVESVDTYYIRLVNPSSVDADWTEIGTWDAQSTEYVSPTLVPSYNRYTDSYRITDANTTTLIANFVANGGLYKDDGTQQVRCDVGIVLGVTPINELGVPTGAEVGYSTVLVGSSIDKQSKGTSLWVSLTAGRYAVRAWRSSHLDVYFVGTTVDEVQWRDLYSGYLVSNTDFGDVTTVQSVTKATKNALALKERKLNLYATRKLPVLVTGTTMSTELYPTNYVADIIIAICLDSYIGRRTLSEIDIANIYSVATEVEDYFGIYKATEFCYTFDKDSMSFEETLAAVANSVFCTAYRQGNILRLSFEKEIELSTLLFNHRNKVPNTEVRNVTFGSSNDYDGIEFQYIEGDTADRKDSLVTLYMPANQSAINPNKIESIGIRNRLQAYFHLNRLYNKLLYTHRTTSFEATSEAALLVLNDKILVADNTRQNTIDGDILSQDGLEITLSQNIEEVTGYDYSLFVQYYDGTVGILDYTQTASNKLLLSSTPMLALVTDHDMYARTTFILGSASNNFSEFLVTEKEAQSNFTYKITASNYDSRYYDHDLDYVNNIVDEFGFEV